MFRKLLPETMIQEFAVIAAFFGVAAGVIGSNDVGWNVQGIAVGFWLAAVAAWVRW